MGRACSTYGERRGVDRVFVRKLEEKSHWENPGVDVKIIRKQIFRKWDGAMDRIDEDQDVDR